MDVLAAVQRHVVALHRQLGHVEEQPGGQRLSDAVHVAAGLDLDPGTVAQADQLPSHLGVRGHIT